MTATWWYQYSLLPVLAICVFALYQNSGVLVGHDGSIFRRSADASLSVEVKLGGASKSTLSSSATGQADCWDFIIPVNASATNRVVTFAPPTNNTDAAQLVRNIFAPNLNFGQTIDGGPKNVSGMFKIFGRLCMPTGRSASKVSPVLHFLTHGGTLDHTYWDFAPGYSYVDQAAARGFATFSYDRLGTGQSDHPNGIQTTQLPLQQEIAHALITALKKATFANVPLNFTSVVGVGHSLGSALTQAVARDHPDDFSALVLTGYSAFPNAAGLGVLSTAQQIANTLVSSGRSPFQGLDNGYLVPADVPQSVSVSFYQSPFFEKSIFDKQFKNRQTNALGETATLGGAFVPASSFTGPVAIVNGAQDFFFCGGDCDSPPSLLPTALAAFFPAASNRSITATIPNAGHNLNLHLPATQAVNTMLDFVVKNVS